MKCFNIMKRFNLIKHFNLKLRLAGREATLVLIVTYTHTPQGSLTPSFQISHASDHMAPNIRMKNLSRHNDIIFLQATEMLKQLEI